MLTFKDLEAMFKIAVYVNAKLGEWFTGCSSCCV